MDFTIGNGGAADFAGRRIADGCPGLAELRMVEGVERLSTELQVRGFTDRNPERAVQAEIQIVDSRTRQNIAPGVSELVLSRNNKATGVEPLVQRRIGKRSVANAVWPGRGSRVGVVKVEAGSEGITALRRVNAIHLPGADDAGADALG